MNCLFGTCLTNPNNNINKNEYSKINLYNYEVEYVTGNNLKYRRKYFMNEINFTNLNTTNNNKINTKTINNIIQQIIQKNIFTK